ncbi:unnamed protein product [Urochloa humidicola]
MRRVRSSRIGGLSSNDDLFSHFFGDSSSSGGDPAGLAFGGSASARATGVPSNDDTIFNHFFGDSSPFGGDPSGLAFGGAGARADRHARGQRAVKAPAIERKLPCSLEELYKGTTKKMKISREIIDASGRTILVQEILTINVKPGWKKGTKVTFMEKGNEAPNVIPADLVFIIDEKPHPVFVRDGNDLVVTHKIKLAEALIGHTVHPTTLDRRSLSVPIKSVIHPRYEEVVHGEGMPIPKDPSRKGSLRIKFDIEFPAVLTANQKFMVGKLFGLQRGMDKDGHHGDNMVVDSHLQCQPPQVGNRKVAPTHGENNSRSGRVIYIGSVPVCIGSN